MTDEDIIDAVRRSFNRAPNTGFDIPPEAPVDYDSPEVSAPLHREGFDGMFDNVMGKTEGVTGIYLEASNRQYVSERSVGHHDALFKWLFENVRLTDEDRIIPWAMNWVSHKDRFEVDIPQSGGGLFQSMANTGADKTLDRVVSGTEITDNVLLYSVTHSLRVLDTPEDAWVNYSRTPPEDTSRDIAMRRQDRNRYRLGDLYQELRFANALPDPVADRPRPE